MKPNCLPGNLKHTQVYYNHSQVLMMEKSLPSGKKQDLGSKNQTPVLALKGLGLVSKTAQGYAHSCEHRNAQSSKNCTTNQSKCSQGYLGRHTAQSRRG